MATDLKLTFRGSGERKLSFSFPYADSSAAAADVKALMQSMVDNGAVFAEAPTALVGAEFVNRTVTPIALA